MVLLILAIAFAITGGVFLFLVYSMGDEQLVKYDKDHSDLCHSADEFVSAIRTSSDVAINCVDSRTNTVRFVYKANEYFAKIEDGKVFVDYGKFGRGRKFLKRVDVHAYVKAAKKAFRINALLDQISHKGRSTWTAYKEFRKYGRILLLVSIAMVLSLTIGICFVTVE